jgi:hypothetical protein
MPLNEIKLTQEGERVSLHLLDARNMGATLHFSQSLLDASGIDLETWAMNAASKLDVAFRFERKN